MANTSPRTLITHALEDLDPEDLLRFTAQMRERRSDDLKPERFPRSWVNGKTRLELADLLVKTFSKKAVAVTESLLRSIDCNDVANNLESSYKALTKRVGLAAGEHQTLSVAQQTWQTVNPRNMQNILLPPATPVKLRLMDDLAPEEELAPVGTREELCNSPGDEIKRLVLSALDTIRSIKTALVGILSVKHRLILNKAQELGLITDREYKSLKGINKENVEVQITELLDNLMDKGEETCERFLKLLKTDHDIKEAFPRLESLNLGPLGPPVPS